MSSGALPSVTASCQIAQQHLKNSMSRIIDAFLFNLAKNTQEILSRDFADGFRADEGIYILFFIFDTGVSWACPLGPFFPVYPGFSQCLEEIGSGFLPRVPTFALRGKDLDQLPT